MFSLASLVLFPYFLLYFTLHPSSCQILLTYRTKTIYNDDTGDDGVGDGVWDGGGGQGWTFGDDGDNDFCMLISNVSLTILLAFFQPAFFFGRWITSSNHKTTDCIPKKMVHLQSVSSLSPSLTLDANKKRKPPFGWSFKDNIFTFPLNLWLSSGKHSSRK